jgi:hypothetical protein
MRFAAVRRFADPRGDRAGQSRPVSGGERLAEVCITR